MTVHDFICMSHPAGMARYVCRSLGQGNETSENQNIEYLIAIVLKNTSHSVYRNDSHIIWI